MPDTTKKFTNPVIAALSTPVNMTDDDSGETTFIFDRPMAVVDVVSELPPGATIAAKYDLVAFTPTVKSTGINYHIQEINPSTQGRVRKGGINLAPNRKYRITLVQTAGALLGAGAANILVTMRGG